MLLVYAGVEDGDHERAHRIVKALRRESLRRGAKLSAAKCLFDLRTFTSRGRQLLRLERRLVVEAPSAHNYFWLAVSEREAGHAREATAAMRGMLRLAERAGDLDLVASAQRGLANPSGKWPNRPNSYSGRMGKAASLKTHDPTGAYAAVQRLKVEVLRLGGHATAVQCVRLLLRVAAAAGDAQAGLRFARQLVEIDESSFASLALALAHERVDDVRRAPSWFAKALRLAKKEGDIHRATKATAGLLRTKGERLVTRDQLQWAMPEALKEPNNLPDYTYLGATLGMP